jgi:hypothetical protein
VRRIPALMYISGSSFNSAYTSSSWDWLVTLRPVFSPAIVLAMPKLAAPWCHCISCSSCTGHSEGVEGVLHRVRDVEQGGYLVGHLGHNLPAHNLAGQQIIIPPSLPDSTVEPGQLVVHLVEVDSQLLSIPTLLRHQVLGRHLGPSE